jgi:hypothetical protein
MPDPTADARYEVKDPQIESILKALAAKLARWLPKGWGFTLQIFSFGENGANFYISNAERADMLNMMREFIAREEAKKGPTT